MKKVLMILVVCVLGMPLFAQERDKPAGSTPPASPEISALQTAYNLAKYGYSTSSASALIGAAEILAKIQTQALGATPERSQSGAAAETKNTTTPEFTPANLLADARKLAARDRTMIAWADSVQKLISAPTRGAAGGPKHAIDTVNAFSNDTYQITFVAGQLAQVYVSGDGSTDLDVFVYDQNGTLITFDDDYGDECLVRWIPNRTSTYRVVVKNLGRYWNRYYITTN